MTTKPVNQARQVLEKVFESSGFDGTWIKGGVFDGTAIMLTAQKMFPNSSWNSTYQQIDFDDCSCIEFSVGSNTSSIMYKANW